MRFTKILFVAILLCAGGVVAAQRDTVTTASGLQYTVLKKGTGRQLKPGEVAVWHYVLTLADGTRIENTRDRNAPMGEKIPSERLISGINEALLLMHVGDKTSFILPPSLAYGRRGFNGNGSLPDVPPNAKLVFETELVDIKQAALRDTLVKTLYKRLAGDTSAPRVDDVIALYKDLKKKKLLATMYMSDDDLNTIGYMVLERDPNAAIKIFQLNVEEYPKVANVYDSLGEAYMNARDFDKAILNYQKSLDLDPKNTNAVEKIKQMKARQAKAVRQA